MKQVGRAECDELHRSFFDYDAGESTGANRADGLLRLEALLGASAALERLEEGLAEVF